MLFWQNLVVVVLFWVVSVRLLVRDLEGEEPNPSRCLGMTWLGTFLVGFLVVSPGVYTLLLTAGSFGYRTWADFGVAGLGLLVGGLAAYFDAIPLPRAWAWSFTLAAFLGLIRTCSASTVAGAWTIVIAFVAAMLMISYEYSVRLPRKKTMHDPRA